MVVAAVRDSTHGPAPRGKTIEERIERLSTASLKRILEPDADVPGAVGDGQVLPDELLSVADLPEVLDRLTPDQKRTLSRAEFASIVETGVRFESVLMAGFSLEILGRRDLTDPRVTYLLHEMGEETRHSRLFVRLLTQIGPTAANPLDNWFVRTLERLVLPVLMSMPALFCLLVLSGEEVPDLMQKLASEHPDTDPMIKSVSKYHRQEEARHLAFARLLFPEQWAAAGPLERFLVRHVGLAHGHRHVRHHCAPGGVCQRRATHLEDVEGRQPDPGTDCTAAQSLAPAAHCAHGGGRVPPGVDPTGVACGGRGGPAGS